MTYHDHHLTAAHRAFHRKAAGAGEENTELAAIAAGFKTATAEMKRFAEDVSREVKANGDLSTEVKAKVDEKLMEFGTKTNDMAKAVTEAVARLDDVEQKLARRGNPAAVTPKSMGDLVLESEQFKKAGMTSASRMAVRVAMSRKDITSATGTVGTGRGDAIRLERQRIKRQTLLHRRLQHIQNAA